MTAIIALCLGFASWLTQFPVAQKQAQELQQPILLVFSGSDWCRPCIQLKKEVLETDMFMSYAEQQLVLLNADFPRSRKHRLSPEQSAHNDSLAERYNPAGSFPLILLLDDKGELIHELTYQGQGPGKFLEQIDSHLPYVTESTQGDR